MQLNDTIIHGHMKGGFIVINLEVKTKISPEEAIKRTKAYFGKGGLGLNLVEDSPGCFNFSGSGGFVNVLICSEEEKTSITFKSREWEYQVKEFAATLP